MNPLRINGISYPYVQIKRQIPKCDLLAWLARQKIFPKVYWRDKEALIERAAVGNILSFSQAPVFDASPFYSVRFYGGMQFPSDKKETLWNSFPSCAFWLPSYEIVQSAEHTELICHFIDEHPTESVIDALDFATDRSYAETVLEIQKEKEPLSTSLWKNQITALQKMIREQQVQKVVLARKKEVCFSEPPSAWKIMENLKLHSQATVFAFELQPHIAFLGASPEHLFFRREAEVSIDVLAGTRPRGITEEDDLALERELRMDPKEQNEFLYVKNFIHSIINSTGEKCAWLDADSVVKTTHVQHLYNRALCVNKEALIDRFLIHALHPTPAVGGFPRKPALEAINTFESFQRGWYSSPVGYISAQETHLAVAIRSGLLHHTSLHLFAGAGIVAGSVAEKEWKEIDHKMRLMLDALA